MLRSKIAKKSLVTASLYSFLKLLIRTVTYIVPILLF
jgi:hypothetical protein